MSSTDLEPTAHETDDGLSLAEAAKRLNLSMAEVRSLIDIAVLRTRIVQGEERVFLPRTTGVTQPLPESAMARLRAARILPEQLRRAPESPSPILSRGNAAVRLTASQAASRELAAIEALRRRWRETEFIEFGPDLMQSLTESPRGTGESVSVPTYSFRTDGPIPTPFRQDMPTNCMMRWSIEVGPLSRAFAPRTAKRPFAIETHVISDVDMHRTRGYVDAPQNHDRPFLPLGRLETVALQNTVTVMVLCATAGWSADARQKLISAEAPAQERVIVLLQDLQNGEISTHPGEPRATAFQRWLTAPFHHERVEQLADYFAQVLATRIGVAEDEWPTLAAAASADDRVVEETVALLVATHRARLEKVAGVGRVLTPREKADDGSV